MPDFVAMSPTDEPFSAYPDEALSIRIPHLKKGHQIPTLGDYITVLHENEGLTGEGIVAHSAEMENYIDITFSAWEQYEAPLMQRSVLPDTKGMPRPLPNDIYHFLGARRTRKTHQISHEYMSDLRNAQSRIRRP
ncbi:hypothetical protein [Celeribacter naphthalenivorans]|uniref:hypothetical protein n=1 Tax=Celeribacter naphthalenivorans TaxID=1614694 RepID=UPI001CFA81AA|nr:hypothetical protein [Celeribacter naphthalenivorans]